MLKYTNSTVVLLLMSLLIFHNFRSIMAEANLDALLFELDNEDESEGLDPNRQAAYPGDLLEDVEVEVADHTGDREGEIPPLPPRPGPCSSRAEKPSSSVSNYWQIYQLLKCSAEGLKVNQLQLLQSRPRSGIP